MVTERTLCCVLENCQTPEGVRCAPGTHEILQQKQDRKHTCGMVSRQKCSLNAYLQFHRIYLVCGIIGQGLIRRQA